MDKKEIKIIKDITEKLLKLVDVDGDFEILESKEKEEESVEIVLNTKDTGVVIGYHGDTLEGLQLVLSLCVARKLGRFVRISIDVGDYKKNSDIDMLVQPPKGIGFGFAGIELELEKKLNKKVDLLTYNSIHPLLKKRILEEEVRIL